MYIIDLSRFKRLTWAGGVSLLVIVAIVRTDLSFGFYFGFMTGFALCWYRLHHDATKIDSSSQIVPQSETRDS